MPTLTRSKPTLEVSLDFAANPTARYSDIHETADGVVSFWRMNSTSTFLDELGINNGTMVSTPATIAGPYPYDSDVGLTFDGASDSAFVPNSVSLTTNSDFSVDGWVRISALPGSTRDLVTKRGSWLLQINTSGKLLWTLKDDTSTVTVTSNSVLQTNTWYHVTGVYDSASALLYVNGFLDSASAYSSGIEVGNQPIIFAGATHTTAPTYQSSQTNNATSATVTCSAPASIASGDLLIAFFMHRSSTTWTPPSGWILWSFETPATGASQVTSQVWYKIATGGEPASYSWTGDASGSYSIGISRFTGQNTLTTFANPGYSQVFTSNTTSKPTGAHIPNTNNCMVLGFFSSRLGSTFTEDSGTERFDTTAGDTAVAMCSQTVASPSSLNITATTSNSVGAAHMVIIAGTGVDETACSLDDWTYWNSALDDNDVGRNYWSKDSGTPTWTNVTLEVRHLSTATPERRHELDTIVAGKMDMVLREVGDKDFDPGNTSSPYLPDIEQRVRVRATWNSTTYDVFRGYAEQWRPVRLGADKEEVQFSAIDGFEALALAPVDGTVAVGFSGSHINAVLNKALWPLADRDIDTGQYVLNGYTLSEGSFGLSVLQDIAASERGIIFVDAAGVFHFHDAAHRGSDSRSTTSQATFSDYPGGTGNLAVSSEIRYQGIQPTRDKDAIINIWTVSPDTSVFGAANQTMIDHESRAKYFARGSSRSTRLAGNADALDQAGNLLTDTAFPADRYESMRVIPLTVESYDKCLDLRISDRVTVKRGFTPGWPGASMTRDYFVEGKTINMEPDTAWIFEFVLSPVSSGNYFQTIMRDGPVSYWRMDTTT